MYFLQSKKLKMQLASKDYETTELSMITNIDVLFFIISKYQIFIATLLHKLSDQINLIRFHKIQQMNEVEALKTSKDSIYSKNTEYTRIISNFKSNKIYSNIFSFQGNGSQLKNHLSSLNFNRLYSITDADVELSGDLVRQLNLCNFLWTLILGSLFIFPFLIIFTSWWKKNTTPIYSINQTTYLTLAKLFRAPNLKYLSLTVKDNTFGKQKAKMLLNLINSSQKINGFIFNNNAGQFDFQESEFSDFKVNMEPIKRCKGLVSKIAWGDVVVV